MIKECKRCNKPFKKPSGYSQKQWQARLYCSKCRYNPKETVICQLCKKEFKAAPSLKRKFCSAKCHYKAEKGQNHGYKGSICSNWNGGKTIHEGYVMLSQPHHPRADVNGYVKEAHLVAEKALNRFLNPQECIHHINGVKTDNRLENLYLFASGSEHTAYHHSYNRGEVNILKSNL